jgi:hypothetical protein
VAEFTPSATRPPVPTFTPTPTLTEKLPTPEPTLTSTEKPLTHSPTATPIPTSTLAVARVKGEIANVRKGPGLGYPVVGQVRAGEEVTVSGRNAAADWLQVVVRENVLTGWIFASLLELDVPVEQVPIAEHIAPSPTQSLTPTSPPIFTSPVTPTLDFKVTMAHLLNADENGGCLGMHTIFITVLDAAGNPLDGIVLGDTYGNIEAVSGSKGPGKAEIDLWLNTMSIIVKRDRSGQSYTSEATRPLSSLASLISDEDWLSAGYCNSLEHCRLIRQGEPMHCHGHYSWRVVFQRTW